MKTELYVKKSVFGIISICAVGMIFFLNFSSSHQAVFQHPAEEQAVRDVLQKFVDAYAQHNVEIAEGIYATEAVVYGPAFIMNGWDHYKQVWSGFLQEFPRASLQLKDDLKIHILETAALAHGTWHEEYWDKTGKMYILDGRITFLLVKRSSKWQIVHQHASVPFKY